MNRVMGKPGLRSDLIHKRIRMGKRWMWVVKDPLSRSLYHFDENEHTLLCKADGSRTLAELIDEARTIYSAQVVAPEVIASFFIDAQSKSLLAKSLLAGNLNRKNVSAGKRSTNPMSVKLPGIDPTYLLDRIRRPIGWVTSPIAMMVIAIAMVCSLVITVSRWDDFASDFTTAATRTENAWILLVTIAAMKIIHELGHAMACLRFGAKCGEIGILFLFGVPCLYADVSQAWLIAKPWKRMLVSAAGMIAELTIASLAVIAWTWTIDGVFRDICVAVVVVGSVSTVLLNGNPLLRYDGYYILSDAIGVPNLAGRSQAMLQSTMPNAFGLESVDAADTEASIATKLGLLGYAIASGTYRFFVISLLIAIIYSASVSIGLGSLFIVMLGLAAMGRLIRTTRSWNRLRHRSQGSAWIVAGATTFVIFIVMACPLPRRVTGPAIITAADHVDVVVSQGGSVRRISLASDVVTAGDTIIELDNPSLDQTKLTIQAKHDRLTAKLQAIRSQRSDVGVASIQIPSLKKAIEEAEEQKRLIDNEINKTTVRASSNGRFFASLQPPRQASDRLEARFWQINPMAAANVGAHLEPGTRLGMIGDASAREATVYLQQHDIANVRVGNDVTFRFADRPRNSVVGRVVEVSASPSIPPEGLQRSGRFRPTTIDSQPTPLYPARVRLNDDDTPPPVHCLVTCQVHVQPQSLWQRCQTFLANSF